MNMTSHSYTSTYNITITNRNINKKLLSSHWHSVCQTCHVRKRRVSISLCSTIYVFVFFYIIHRPSCILYHFFIIWWEPTRKFITFYTFLYIFLLGFRGPRISQLDPTYHEKVPLVLRIKKRYDTLDLISITI